jgi:hypothetical protein
MSTETVTSTGVVASTPARSAATTSARVRAFLIVFSITAMVVYVLSDFLGWALFTFHPATGRVEWGQMPPRRGEGPVMYWYGWVATTAIVSTVLAFLATFLPENITRRIPLFLLWLLPLLAVPLMFYTLMSFWTK